MESPGSSPRVEGNWLLAALSPDSFRRVSDVCETVPTVLRDVLIQPDAAIEYVYFPENGCLSMVTLMGDGSAVEVGTVGWEGMVGLSLLDGVDSVSTQCLVQMDGRAKRITRTDFETQVRENPEFARLLHRYAQVWTNQVARGSSCNGVHSVEERCARWLLITQDRVDSDVLPLTHEFLAIMLGVRRASVTLAAAGLQRAGLITYKRGKITVLDRKGLEDASCECYAAMRAIYTKLLPIEPPPRDDG